MLILNSFIDFYFLIIAKKKNITTIVVIAATIGSIVDDSKTGTKTSAASKNK